MSYLNYAFIKDGIVVNIAVFENTLPEESLPNLAVDYGVDSIVLATENAYMGSTYSDGIFTAPHRFNGWIWNDDKKEWEPTTPYPTDGKTYEWDESLFIWVAVEE
jgi:hypothetical protein